ncbi:hypothetical protein GALMADRAFT_67401 [Galerina marginata CBS 339.88]|uniref:Cytochrome P450 n=1 Tax=Galerina marginata (strain CBS 339.88) TaxID=685588 RepID=A0A067T0Y1_GALM3|nr:hypothetical protein GALMADRAFT_67401 [Galerina marginata CBS 339.88]
MRTTTNDALAILVALILLFGVKYFSGRSSKPLPPGPRPLPLIGNIFDLASAGELWLRATEWSKQFGDIVYLHVLGQSVLFLNSREAAVDLLDKRSAIYSDKPSLVMVGDLCGCKEMIPFLPYGESFRRRRKLMQKTLGPRSIPAYHSILHSETHTFIDALVSSPSNYLRHIRRYSGGITLAVVYGYPVTSSSDKYLLLAEECMGLLANEIASGTGLWLVDVLPFLRYLPSWFPGAGFKRKAAIWKPRLDAFMDRPYENAKSRWKSNSILPSFCSSILDEKEDLIPGFELDIKTTANSMYAASADTTISTISHFLLAMINYPQIFVKAKKEIETVVGTERLPTFSDREHLPYIEAILNETWRWGCPVPINLPHLLQEDDIYQGLLIPKGTMVIANMWAMSRDETLYPNASEFVPDRFMEELTPECRDKMDPRNFIFGFGRRRCPGADLVDSSIWLLIATMVSTLEFSKPLDETGNYINPTVVFDNMFFR